MIDIQSLRLAPDRLNYKKVLVWATDLTLRIENRA